jgi:hypothetical protein
MVPEVADIVASPETATIDAPDDPDMVRAPEAARIATLVAPVSASCDPAPLFNNPFVTSTSSDVEPVCSLIVFPTTFTAELPPSA